MKIFFSEKDLNMELWFLVVVGVKLKKKKHGGKITKT